jgi:hypothetical protein
LAQEVSPAPSPRLVAAFVQACSQTLGTDSDLRQASNVAYRMARTCPDPLVYAALLNAINVLINNDAERFAGYAQVFQECCRSGHLNVHVLQQMRKVCPCGLYRRLTNLDPAFPPSLEAVPRIMKDVVYEKK